MDKINAIIEAICIITANGLKKASVTWEEVEQVYASGEYPEINASIDYIVKG